MAREDKNEVICNDCKKLGHLKSSCFILLRKNHSEENYVGTRNGTAGSATDVVVNTMTANAKIWRFMPLLQ
jgi:hypothetical protein